MQRIGVFVCHCGTNIAATVDVKKVVEMALHEPGVVHAEDYAYMCSEAGQELIHKAIKEKQLTGLVVCSCSPRMHETTFRNAAEKAGLNPYMVEIANIREHCSWIHKDMEEATEKAVILMRAAVAKVNLDAPLQPGESRVTKRALVIGGGIAGIQTALDIAEAGYPVDIVEKTPSIGGRMSQLDKTFPTLDCSSCILTPKMGEVNAHPLINIYTYSEVESVSGFVGDFTVEIRKKARSVDMNKCTGCGLCQEKCPSKKTPSEFNRGLSNRSAIYTPFAQAVPNVPVIDRDACIKFKTGKCGICSKVCQAGAIDYEQKDEIVTEKYGAIVVATGFDMIKLDKYDEYAYSQSKDVITSLELERIMNAAGPTGGHLERLSDGKAPKEIVFVQCVGSRCADDRGKSYCSKICCMYTAKHAMLIRDKYPDTNVTVFYIDVRTPGKNFDEFYRRAVEDYGVNYIKGQVGKVIPQPNGKLLVQGADLIDNKQILKEADMVVARVLHRDAVREGVRRRERQLVLRLDGALHARRLRRLHAVDLAVRLQVLDGIGHARNQPAAADRHQHRVHVRHLLQDFQAHRALACDHVRVVEGMHKGHPLLLAQVLGVRACVVIRPRHQMDLRAVTLRRLNLRNRRDIRHADDRSRPALLRTQRHTLRVVARAARNHATAQFLRRQLRNLVIRPAHLERTRHLQVFRLQPDRRVRGKFRRVNQICLARDLLQHFGRVVNVVHRQSSHNRIVL